VQSPRKTRNEDRVAAAARAAYRGDMSLASWSVKNRVAVNIFTLVVIFAGYYAAFTQLQRDLFPDVSTNFIQVTTLDPETGAPEDIERTITVPIEEELGNVDYLEEIRSISQDNFSNIFIEVDPARSESVV
jgi:multidrug efflux pump subunit AcrB